MDVSLEVLDLLTEYNYTIAFAESITGGALVSELVKNGGASAVLSYSVVTYSRAAKETFLKSCHAFLMSMVVSKSLR